MNSMPLVNTRKVKVMDDFVQPTSTVRGVSDARVPGITVFASYRAAAIAKALQTVRDRQVIDEFYVFVADLPRQPHAQRSAMGHGKVAAIHAVTEKCLRMQSIGHIDAVPGIGFY